MIFVAPVLNARSQRVPHLKTMDMKRIWLALIIVGAAIAFSGCAVKNQPDSATKHGGGKPDPNSLHMTDEYESAIPADAIKSFGDVRKEAVLPDEMR